MIHCTGKEWNTFRSNERSWPGESYIEGAWVVINGEGTHDAHRLMHSTFRSADKISIEGGTFFPDSQDDAKAEDLEARFKRWRRESGVDTLVVLVPKHRESTLREFIARLEGARVLA